MFCWNHLFFWSHCLTLGAGWEASWHRCSCWQRLPGNTWQHCPDLPICARGPGQAPQLFLSLVLSARKDECLCFSFAEETDPMPTLEKLLARGCHSPWNPQSVLESVKLPLLSGWTSRYFLFFKSVSFIKDKSLEGGFPCSSHPPFSNSFLGQTFDLPEVNGCFVPGFFGSCFTPTCASLSLGNEAVKGKASQCPYCSETKWLKILIGLQ